MQHPPGAEFSLSQDEFERKKPLFVDNILTGMDRYFYRILEGLEPEFEQFADILTEWEKEGAAYGDFYYPRLPEEIRMRVKKSLAEPACLSRMEPFFDPEKLYYMLTPDIRKLLVTLSYREIVFSTFYFPESRLTLWSSYAGKWVLFSDDRIRLQRACWQFETIRNN
ncbi:hypothetical protein [Anaerolentibacter hominis]|uniref:hypothetical protein n=1 Tax=Anaerolentibacter hominis TaxID=3079009 RepID=UPI0031B88A24